MSRVGREDRGGMLEIGVEARRGGSGLDSGFLRRLRRTSLIFGLLGVLVLATYVGVRAGFSALAGLALSVLNLKLLEEIFARVLSPGRSHGGWKSALLILLKLPLLLGGIALALGPFKLSPAWFVAGFAFVLVVALLKALGILLTSSRALGPSGRGAANRRRLTGLLVLALVFGSALILSPQRLRAQEAEAPGRASEQVGTEQVGSEQVGSEQKGEASEPAEARESGQGEPELPSLLQVIKELNPHAGWAEFLERWQNPIYAFVVVIILSAIALAAYSRRTMIPGGLQNGVEYFVEMFHDFVVGMLGPRGKEFVPFLGTLFVYIWFNNLQGLIPFFKSPTSVVNTTAALGISVFLYVQYTGVTKLGLWGYFHHMMGAPNDLIGWCMVPLMFPLHIIEELAKPLSLSLRLFGNILGEDVLLGVFAGLGVALLAFTHMPVGIPLQIPFVFLAILGSTIQALVFTLLAAIYFSQMLPHEEEGEEGEGH
jgi:F-type H+-transporting ATPase subunit a